MKTLIITAAFCLSVTFNALAQNGPVVNPTLKDASKEVIGGANSGKLNVIDPAITDINFRTIKQSTGDRLQITVTVKNLGLANYSSNPNQQNVQLWEEWSSTNRRMVKAFPFQNLNGGASLNFVHERAAFKPADEFPPNYVAVIVYDPDIRIDANPSNDDSNLSNNTLAKNPRN
ncbi:MAG: hypothetical protein ACK4GN_15275 [Runella sp.]